MVPDSYSPGFIRIWDIDGSARSLIRSGPGFSFVTNAVSVSKYSNKIVMTHILNKNGLIYVIIFTHLKVLCDLERSYSSVEVIISIEATAIGGAWRCLHAHPRCPASFYWEMAIRATRTRTNVYKRLV